VFFSVFCFFFCSHFPPFPIDSQAFLSLLESGKPVDSGSRRRFVFSTGCQGLSVEEMCCCFPDGRFSCSFPSVVWFFLFPPFEVEWMVFFLFPRRDTPCSATSVFQDRVRAGSPPVHPGPPFPGRDSTHIFVGFVQLTHPAITTSVFAMFV